MAPKRKPNSRRPSQARGKPADKGERPVRRSSSIVLVRKTGGAWELVQPRCALDRAENLEEVRKMIEADEIDVAREELRWLLGGCTDFIDAHKALGEIALLDHDLPLARGHFGYAYQIGAKALERAGAATNVPYRLPANQPFFEAAKGLALCLRELGKAEMAAEVVDRLLSYDPTDPLGVRQLLASGKQGEALSLEGEAS